MRGRVYITLVILLLMAAGTQLSFTFSGNTKLQQRIPVGFPLPVYDYKNNPLTKEGFELGKRLFYDGQLALDGQTACASCHQQFAAFADFEHVFSHGVADRFTIRNAPPLFNLAWHKEFHMDGGINHIEWQPLSPLTGANEMDNTIDNVVRVLKNDKVYPPMFKKAFGTDTINSQRILHALAQFTGYIVSADAKYDRVKSGKDHFTEWEAEGYKIFQAKCAGCHSEPLFTDLQYHNIGLPVDSFLNDYGRMMITGDPRDSLQFKTPTLRNITRTGPYMHDGRFWGLSTAIDHWETGVLTDPATSHVLKKTVAPTQQEVRYLVSFLHTLLDTVLLNDKRLQDPIPGNLIHGPQH